MAWKSYFDHIEWIVSKGHKVVLIRSLPSPKIDGKKWVSKNVKSILDNNYKTLFNESKPSEIKEKDENNYPKFNKKSVLIFDPIDVLCDVKNDRCYDILESHGPIFNLGSHLSYVGASLVSNEIIRLLNLKGWIKK